MKCIDMSGEYDGGAIGWSYKFKLKDIKSYFILIPFPRRRPPPRLYTFGSFKLTASTSGVPIASRTAYNYTIRHLHTARQPNEPYTPWEVCDEPLIPHPTRTAWTYRAVFRLLRLNPPSYILVLLVV